MESTEIKPNMKNNNKETNSYLTLAKNKKTIGAEWPESSGFRSSK